MSVNYLVAAALQDELEAFHALFGYKTIGVGNDVSKVIINDDNNFIEVYTYTPNNMGMPINAAELLRVILEIKPAIVIYIGTCAGLKENNTLGTVLVPMRAFSYEAGKAKNDDFKPDLTSFYFSNPLRGKATQFKNRQKVLNFEIVTDEDMCSGAGVIDDENRKQEILSVSSRKMAGLDMEAFAIAYLNQMFLHKGCDLIVAKGISDNGNKKDQTEESGYKNLAMKNSSAFAYEFIKFLSKGSITPEKNNENGTIIFNGNTIKAASALEAKGGQLWDRFNKKNFGTVGEGTLGISDNVITIHRSNTEGRYEVRLQSYTFGDTEYKVIIKDHRIAGARKLRIRLDVKSDGSDHSLSFNFKETTLGRIIATKTIRINTTDWLAIELDFNLNPSVNCYLRIDDFNVSNAPSNVNIKNLIIFDNTLF